jgi:hypothetical protein
MNLSFSISFRFLRLSVCIGLIVIHLQTSYCSELGDTFLKLISSDDINLKFEASIVKGGSPQDDVVGGIANAIKNSDFATLKSCGSFFMKGPNQIGLEYTQKAHGTELGATQLLSGEDGASVKTSKGVREYNNVEQALFATIPPGGTAFAAIYSLISEKSVLNDDWRDILQTLDLPDEYRAVWFTKYLNNIYFVYSPDNMLAWIVSMPIEKADLTANLNTEHMSISEENKKKIKEIENTYNQVKKSISVVRIIYSD